MRHSTPQSHMDRVPEPEIMDDASQVRAYADADFAEAHSNIIANAKRLLSGRRVEGFGLDLGCGPGDMILRVLEAFPAIAIEAVDGSSGMIRAAEKFLKGKAPAKRIAFTCGVLPDVEFKRRSYDFIFSSSLLHHLHDPSTLWNTIRRCGRKGAVVYVGDLTRPVDGETARRIAERYCGDEPDILKRDFYNSLLAAFTPAEIDDQLAKAGLSSLTVETISDRHVAIFGVI